MNTVSDADLFANINEFNSVKNGGSEGRPTIKKNIDRMLSAKIHFKHKSELEPMKSLQSVFGKLIHILNNQSLLY